MSTPVPGSPGDVTARGLAGYDTAEQDPVAPEASGAWEAPPTAGWRRAAAGAAVAVTIVAALGAAALAGRWTAPAVRAPENPVDIGFSRDMKVHHAQGVQMALTEYGRTDDGSLRYLAFDIATSQQAQLGMMSGWLQLWGANQSSSGPRMAWMGRPHTGPMPGMATAEQVAALQTLPVATADEQFLRLMIRHHQGALPMAAHARDQASTPQVREFAGSMYDVQLAEINQMQQVLQGRGLAPEPPTTAAPDPATGHHGAPSAPGTGVFPDPSAPAAAGHGQHTLAAAPAGSSAPAPAAAPPSAAVPASPGDDQAGSDPGSGPDPADGVGAPGPVAH